MVVKLRTLVKFQKGFGHKSVLTAAKKETLSSIMRLRLLLDAHIPGIVSLNTARLTYKWVQMKYYG